ncbi:hypothetical protein GCM10020221_02570 [Streptomyces thioluteus]|uniref:Uncharacterized protein n=2 Tax=Streptomyces thioluteus TaxID=66431 RepID=A0ABN3WE18_STRTU
MLLAGASFVLFAIPMKMATGGTTVSPMWLIVIYMLQTLR